MELSGTSKRFFFFYEHEWTFIMFFSSSAGICLGVLLFGLRDDFTSAKCSFFNYALSKL